MDSQRNETDTDWCLLQKPNWDQWCSAGATLTLVGIIQGLIGSALVIVAVTTRKELKHAKNTLVTFLTIPDVFMLTVLYSANVDTYIHKRWRYGVVLCRIWPILAALFVGSSMMLQATIAIQKYVAFFYKKKILYTKMTIAAALVVSWIFPAIIFTHDFHRAVTEIRDDSHVCFSCIYYNEISCFVKFTVALGFVLVPCIICVLCYASIMSAVRASRRQGPGVSPAALNSVTREWIRRDLELAKMFAMSLFVMMLGYMPFSALQVFDTQHAVSGEYYMLFASLHCFVTGSNVWLYGLMHKDFRAAYKDVLRSWLCRMVTVNGMANSGTSKPYINSAIITITPALLPSTITSSETTT